MIVDAHQHVWDPDRAEYPWLGPALSPIDRTMEFDELAPTLRALGIDATVLVQSADNAADTDLMLDVANQHPEIVAVVAWAPLDRPRELGARLAWLGTQPLVSGVRTLLHERAPGWLAEVATDKGLALLAASGFSLDFPTAGYAALAELPAVGSRHPDLRIVIDHLGKPPIGGSGEERAEWRALLAEAAANPLTHAKVSGLYSSAGELASWTADGIRPFIDDALDLFGADRLMYGGDWPISQLAGGYARAWRAITGILDDLSSDERAAVLGGTARSFYRIDPSGGS